MSTETLRRAASLMRERAEEAGEGAARWTVADNATIAFARAYLGKQ